MRNELETPPPNVPTHGRFRERVVRAAEAELQQNGSVGPIELFQQMHLLKSVHVEGWRKGTPSFRVLEEHLEIGPKKFGQAIRYFREWAQERGLRSVEASYVRRGIQGVEQLQITKDGDPQREELYRTHFAPGDLPEKKRAKIAEKLNKAPDLTVFKTVREKVGCAECNAELVKGDLLFMEKGEALCLVCADLDHLVFLPAGDAALSRRARKHSPLSAVVVRFNRARKRYERQGLLVTDQALTRAEDECAADASKRATARARAAVVRQEEDREFMESLTQTILERFPQCPTLEARKIAAHTGLRSSGRVGRSAAGRALSPEAVELAVNAHIRHEHTNYDTLLMKGVGRQEARAEVRGTIERVRQDWALASQ